MWESELQLDIAQITSVNEFNFTPGQLKTKNSFILKFSNKKG